MASEFTKTSNELLSKAVIKNDLKLVKELLAQGHDPFKPDKTGFSPSSRAKNLGFTDLCSLFNGGNENKVKPESPKPQNSQEQKTHKTRDGSFQTIPIWSETIDNNSKLVGQILMSLSFFAFLFNVIVASVMLVVGIMLYFSNQNGGWIMTCPMCKFEFAFRKPPQLLQANLSCKSCGCVLEFYKDRLTHTPPV